MLHEQSRADGVEREVACQPVGVEIAQALFSGMASSSCRKAGGVDHQPYAALAGTVTRGFRDALFRP